MKSSPEAHDINSSAFTQQYSEEISRLLDIAGILIEPGDDLVSATQPLVRGDHFHPETLLHLSAEDQIQALHIFENMGMTQAVYPTGGTYDRVLVLGGVHSSNLDRLKFVYEQIESNKIDLFSEQSIVLLGGTRPIQEGETSNGESMLTESDSLREAAVAHFGNLILSQVHLRLGLLPKSHNLVSKRVLRSDKEVFNVVNANAVSRPQGAPRHTTASTTLDWLTQDNIEDGARVLFVSGNPYIHRTTQDVLSVIRHSGRSFDVESCGPAATPNLLVRRAYGELGRIIFSESVLQELN